MHCPHCGIPLSPGETVFCPRCRKSLEGYFSPEEVRADGAGNQVLVHSSYSVVMAGSLGGIGLAVVGVISGGLLGGAAWYILFPVLVGGNSLITLLNAGWHQRASKEGIWKVLNGERVVHWTYSTEEWQRFTRNSRRKAIKGELQAGAYLIGVVVVGGLILLALSDRKLSVFPALEIVVGAAAAVSLLSFLQATVAFLLRPRLHASEALISPAGIILGGWYWSLKGLVRVAYKAGDPAVLACTTRTRKVISGGKVPSADVQEIEVPVPRGRETEAEQLVQALTATPR